jgi:hypothetical protein
MKRHRLTLLCLGAALALGCPGPADTGAVDADGDGSPAAEDCDDADADTYPGAQELCDGVDNDCDGSIDEDVLESWYADADGDGYGDPLTREEGCTQPSGWVSTSGDCDDDNADVHPGATELCDGLDNDCDSQWDEDAEDASTWYADEDGDGYGDPLSTQLACEQPDDSIDNDDDCDDGDRDINPEAEEICNGVDDDCDGQTDEDDAVDPLTWYLDEDGDGFGQTDATAEACDEPSGYTGQSGDCDDGDATVYPGADEYCDEIDQDCDGVPDEDDAVDAPFWYHDVDGDGYGDPDIEVQQCWAVGDMVSDNTDCNDFNGEVNPGATELCDGLDNDCDESFDEDDAADALTWYLDGDGDGYGDASSSTTACDEPSGYGPYTDDCDDADPDVYPDAVQLCGDGIDNDCRGGDTICPAAGELLITEFMKDPAAMSDSDGEWLEIYNASATPFELEGLILLDGGGEDWQIDESFELAAGDWAVLSRSSAATTATDLVWSGFQLVNTEDEIILATYGSDGTDGEVIHEIWYDDSAWPDSAGASISLDPDMLDPDLAADPSSWCQGQTAYDSGDRGTPGAANDDC